MNARFLLLILSAATVTSCSTVYKSGQTPDDVYYSPAKEQPAYVNTQEKEESRNNYDDEYANTNLNDRYIRMKRYNRDRWSAFDDDYLYWNDSRWNSQPYYNSWGTYSKWGWNSWFSYSPWTNPFCPAYYGAPIVIVNPKPVYRNPVANGPRVFNLNTFTTPTNNSNYNSKFGNNSYNNGNSNNRTYNSSDSRSSSPVRTFDRSNNSSSGSSGTRSSGSSGSSGGSTPTRTFPKKGG